MPSIEVVDWKEVGTREFPLKMIEHRGCKKVVLDDSDSFFVSTFLFQVEGNALTTTWWFLFRGECLAFEMIKIKT